MRWRELELDPDFDPPSTFYAAEVAGYDLDVEPVPGPVSAWTASIHTGGDRVWQSPRTYATAWRAMAEARAALVEALLGVLDEARA